MEQQRFGVGSLLWAKLLSWAILHLSCSANRISSSCTGTLYNLNVMMGKLRLFYSTYFSYPQANFNFPNAFNKIAKSNLGNICGGGVTSIMLHFTTQTSKNMYSGELVGKVVVRSLDREGFCVMREPKGHATHTSPKQSANLSVLSPLTCQLSSKLCTIFYFWLDGELVVK